MNETTIESLLLDKVRRLELKVGELQRQLEMANSSSLGALLGPFRLRETVLLYIGKESGDRHFERLAQEFGGVIANQALRHLFELNHAPVPGMEREIIRSAFNRGMDRW